jgi:hypothetical protein
MMRVPSAVQRGDWLLPALSPIGVIVLRAKSYIQSSVLPPLICTIARAPSGEIITFS